MKVCYWNMNAVDKSIRVVSCSVWSQVACRSYQPVPGAAREWMRSGVQLQIAVYRLYCGS